MLFELLKIDGNYSLFEVNKNNILDVINSMNVLGIKEINVTLPYKEDIMKSLDYIST